jgi:dihydrofolate reductase
MKMAKIVVSMWTTLDGFVAGPQDEMDWLLPDEDLQRYEQELVEKAGSLMLGRVTHGDFAGHWPHAAQDPGAPDEVRAYAQRLDTMAKIVVSASGEVAQWRNTQTINRIDPGDIAELKRDADGDIVVYGSLAVIRSLLESHLVDEFHLLVHPLFLGDGKALFGPDRPPVRLGLISAEPFSSGVVLMKYRPTDPTPSST